MANFPRSFVIVHSGRNPTRLGGAEIQPEEFTDRILFMSMFNDIVRNTNDENYVWNAEKVKNYAMRFSQGHFTFLGPGSEEKWYGSSSHAQKGQWNCVAAKMVQRFQETGHPEFKNISALSRGILKQKTGKTSIHFNGDSMNTELLFQTIHSVNQLSVYGAVATWCYRLGSTEEEKGKSQCSCGQQDFDQVETRRSRTLGISSGKSYWKQDARKSPELR